MRLYLDVETCRQSEEDAFLREEVVAIGVLEDLTPYSPESSNNWDPMSVRHRIFAKWELGDEAKVISQFYSYLRGLAQDVTNGRLKFVEVVGFNVLRVDIPLLVQKGVEHCAGSAAELNRLWHDMLVRDYLQISLPFHEMRLKGLKFETLVKKAKDAGLDVPEPYGSGEEVKEWCKNGEYDKIKNRLETELRALRIIDLNYRRVYNI